MEMVATVAKGKKKRTNNIACINEPSQDCFFNKNIEYISSSLREILQDYTDISKVQLETRESQKRQAEEVSREMSRLNETLTTISSKLESSFDLGKSFIKLFRLILMVFFFVVLVFGAVIVYITQVDIKTELITLSNKDKVEKSTKHNDSLDDM